MPTSPLVLLLPPSEGKAAGGDGPPWDPTAGAFGALAPHRRAVAAALAAAGGGDDALLGVGGAHLERGRAANLALAHGTPTRPAWARYTGVVHGHLGIATLPPAARRRAEDGVVVVSALLGLVAAGDPVPDYRLAANARLAPLGHLAAWWRPRLAAELAAFCAGRVVVDLLPAAHLAAVDLHALDAPVLRARLVDRSGRPGGHDAKAAKGHLARHLLTSRAAPARALRAFRDDRWAVVTEVVAP